MYHNVGNTSASLMEMHIPRHNHHVLIFTSHPKVQLLHNDVVLEIRVPSKVEADPVAQFVILERLDLKEAEMFDCCNKKA